MKGSHSYKKGGSHTITTTVVEAGNGPNPAPPPFGTGGGQVDDDGDGGGTVAPQVAQQPPAKSASLPPSRTGIGESSLVQILVEGETALRLLKTIGLKAVAE